MARRRPGRTPGQCQPSPVRFSADAQPARSCVDGAARWWPPAQLPRGGIGPSCSRGTPTGFRHHRDRGASRPRYRSFLRQGRHRPTARHHGAELGLGTSKTFRWPDQANQMGPLPCGSSSRGQFTAGFAASLHLFAMPARRCTGCGVRPFATSTLVGEVFDVLASHPGMNSAWRLRRAQDGTHRRNPDRAVGGGGAVDVSASVRPYVPVVGSRRSAGRVVAGVVGRAGHVRRGR